MRMTSSLYAMALMMTVMGSGNMGFGSSRSNYEPTLPPVKRVLPGKFKGSIPKGCKIELTPIEIKWQGFRLTKGVDIVFGSEKAKQKAIIKAEYQIKEYLQYHQRYGALKPEDFKEFDIVEILPKEKDTSFDKFLK